MLDRVAASHRVTGVLASGWGTDPEGASGPWQGCQGDQGPALHRHARSARHARGDGRSRICACCIGHGRGGGDAHPWRIGSDRPLQTAILGAPTIILPMANHDNNQHDANENIRIANLWYGIRLMAAVLTMERWRRRVRLRAQPLLSFRFLRADASRRTPGRGSRPARGRSR